MPQSQYPPFVANLDPEVKAAYIFLYEKWCDSQSDGDDETTSVVSGTVRVAFRKGQDSTRPDIKVEALVAAVKSVMVPQLKEEMRWAKDRGDSAAVLKHSREIIKTANSLKLLQGSIDVTPPSKTGALAPQQRAKKQAPPSAHAGATQALADDSSLLALARSGRNFFIPLCEVSDEEGYALGFMGNQMKLSGLVGLDHLHALVSREGQELVAGEIADPTYHKIFRKGNGTDKQKASDVRAFLDIAGELPVNKDGESGSEFSMQAEFSMQFPVDRKGRLAAVLAIADLEKERDVVLREGNQTRLGEIDQLLRELRRKKPFKSHEDEVSFETVKRAVMRALDVISEKNSAAGEYFRTHVYFNNGVTFWFDAEDTGWITSSSMLEEGSFPQISPEVSA